MSFSPEIFRKKLDGLQETQDSIVSISQWVLFHHRHASQLCDIWAEYTLTSDQAKTLKKKLLLLYLCNDVVQQARHKRKPEFSAGFAPKLPLVIYLVYGSVDEAIKPKIERLISVWSQRNVFTAQQIGTMNRAIALLKAGEEFSEETLKLEASSKLPLGPALATDLVHLNNLYTHMTTLLDTSLANLAQVGLQAKFYLPEDHSALENLPLPKVYVSKLNVLEKLCQMTVGNLQEVKKTRQEVLAVLAQLADLVLGSALADDTKIGHLSEKLDKILSTRAELLEMIDEPHSPNDEEPSPAFESNSALVADTNVNQRRDSNDNLVPTYEDSSSDESDKGTEYSGALPPPVVPRKRSLSGSSTNLGLLKKSVAFSEEIEVKEFERDEQANFMDILLDYNSKGGDSDMDDDEEEDEYGLQVSPREAEVFEAHHKDALELKREHQGEANADHSNGTLLEEPEQEELGKAGLLSLLSKLN